MAKSHNTPVELYVKAMLSTHKRKALPKKIVQKALVLVSTKLDNPCCTDSEATINLITRRNHVFTSTIEKLLSIIPKAGNKKSLQRTKTLLERSIDCSCE